MAAGSQSRMAVDASACWRQFTADSSCCQRDSHEHEKKEMIAKDSDLPQVSSATNITTTCRAHRGRSQFDSVASGFSYTDELSQKLSRINGAINQMSKEKIEARLAEFGLNTGGSKEVLKKRLKNHYKKQRLAQTNKPEEQMKYDYLIVIDFEATCSVTNENFIHEIIEFPAVLVDTRQKAVCNVFQRFCKPKVNRVLTEFCTNLTGISQAQVDKAKDFKEVYKEFLEWMTVMRLGTDKSFAVITDGPWDMARFFKTQMDVSEIEYPKWAKSWINLRKAYTAFYGVGRVNLQHMLDDLGMKFQGRPHCGLDDARNIAAIVVRLLQDGCIMRINEYLHEDSSYRKSQSPPKSRLTNPKRPTGSPSCSTLEDVPQEGENVEDLLAYMRIQQS